ERPRWRRPPPETPSEISSRASSPPPRTAGSGRSRSSTGGSTRRSSAISVPEQATKRRTSPRKRGSPSPGACRIFPVTGRPPGRRSGRHHRPPAGDGAGSPAPGAAPAGRAARTSVERGVTLMSEPSIARGMRPNRHPLDEDSASRLLQGLVHPDDAPPGYGAVAGLLNSAAQLPLGSVDEDAAATTVSAMVEVIRDAAPAPEISRRKA